MTTLLLPDKLSPMFYAVFDRIVPATNKYMATLFNTSATHILMVNRILEYNWQVTAFAESSLEQYLARIIARTTGTNVTIHSHDPLDNIPSGIIADTNSTSVTEDHIIRRNLYANNERQSAGSVPQIPDYLAYTIFGEQGSILWERPQGMKGIVLRQNQGITIRNITSATAGGVSYAFEFTQLY